MAGAAIDIGVVMHGFGAANETLGVMKQSLDTLHRASRELAKSWTKDLSDAQRKSIKETKLLDAASTDYKQTLAEMRREIGMTVSTLSTFAGVALRGVHKGLLDSGREMQKYRLMMKAVSGSTEAATKRLNELVKISTKPGLEFRGLVKGVAQLQAAGLEANVATEAVVQFGNALAAVGAPAEDLEGVLRALSQIQAKGVVYAEEIQQIAERLPQVRQIMLDVFKTAKTEILQQAGLTAEEFAKAMIGGLSKLDRAMETTDNAIKNFQTSIFLLKASVGEELLPEVTRFIKNLSSFVAWVNKLSPALKRTIGRVIGLTAVLTTGTGVVLGFVVAFNQLNAAMANAAAAGALVTGSLTAIKVALIATGVGLTAVAFGTLFAYLHKGKQTVDELGTALQNIKTVNNNLASGGVDTFIKQQEQRLAILKDVSEEIAKQDLNAEDKKRSTRFAESVVKQDGTSKTRQIYRFKEGEMTRELGAMLGGVVTKGTGLYYDNKSKEYTYKLGANLKQAETAIKRTEVESFKLDKMLTEEGVSEKDVSQGLGKVAAYVAEKTPMSIWGAVAPKGIKKAKDYREALKASQNVSALVLSQIESLTAPDEPVSPAWRVGTILTRTIESLENEIKNSQDVSKQPKQSGLSFERARQTVEIQKSQAEGGEFIGLKIKLRLAQDLKILMDSANSVGFNTLARDIVWYLTNGNTTPIDLLKITPEYVDYIKSYLMVVTDFATASDKDKKTAKAGVRGFRWQNESGYAGNFGEIRTERLLSALDEGPAGSAAREKLFSTISAAPMFINSLSSRQLEIGTGGEGIQRAQFYANQNTEVLQAGFAQEAIELASSGAIEQARALSANLTGYAKVTADRGIDVMVAQQQLALAEGRPEGVRPTEVNAARFGVEAANEAYQVSLVQKDYDQAEITTKGELSGRLAEINAQKLDALTLDQASLTPAQLKIETLKEEQIALDLTTKALLDNNEARRKNAEMLGTSGQGLIEDLSADAAAIQTDADSKATALQAQRGSAGVQRGLEETKSRFRILAGQQQEGLAANLENLRAGAFNGGRALTGRAGAQFGLNELTMQGQGEINAMQLKLAQGGLNTDQEAELRQEIDAKQGELGRRQAEFGRQYQAGRVGQIDQLEDRISQLRAREGQGRRGRFSALGLISGVDVGGQRQEIENEAELEQARINLDASRLTEGDDVGQAGIDISRGEVEENRLRALERLYDQTYKSIARKVTGYIGDIISSVRSMFKDQQEAREAFAKTIEDMNIDLNRSITDIYQDESLSYQQKEARKLELLRDYNDQREDEEKEHAETLKKIQASVFEAFKEQLIENATQTALMLAGEAGAKKLQDVFPAGGGKLGTIAAGLGGGADLIKQLRGNTTDLTPSPASVAAQAASAVAQPAQTAAEAVQQAIQGRLPEYKSEPARIPTPSDAAANFIGPWPLEAGRTLSPAQPSASSLATPFLSSANKQALALGGSTVAAAATGYGVSQLGDKNNHILNWLKVAGGAGLAGLGIAAGASGWGAGFAAPLIGSGVTLAGGAINNMGNPVYDSPHNDIILQSMASQAGQSQRSAEDMSRLVVQGFQEGYADQAESAGETSVNVSGHFELGHRELQFIADETNVMRKRGLIG